MADSVSHRSMLTTIRDALVGQGPAADPDPDPGIDADAPADAQAEPAPDGHRKFWGEEDIAAATGAYGWQAIPAAYACVGHITAALAAMPKVVVEEQRLGSRAYKVVEHELNHVMRYPLPWLDGVQAWEIVAARLVATGNGFFELLRGRRGGVIGMNPCWSATGRARPGDAAGPEWTVQDIAGAAHLRRRLDERSIARFHGLSLNGLSSPSPIERTRQGVLASSQEAQMFLSRRFGDTIRKSVVRVDPDLAKQSGHAGVEDLKRQLEDFKADWAKVDQQKMSTLVMPAGLRIDDRSLFSASDMQVIEILRWTVEDICRIFGVPPRLLGHYASGQRVDGKVGTQAEDFWRYGVRPWATRISAQMTLKGLSVADRMRRLSVRMISEPVREGSPEENARIAGTSYADGGVVTRNEAREMMSMPPDPDGDEYAVPRGGTDTGGRPQAAAVRGEGDA